MFSSTNLNVNITRGGLNGGLNGGGVCVCVGGGGMIGLQPGAPKIVNIFFRAK